MKLFYPEIDTGMATPLRVMASQVKEYPDYFTREECPYEDDLAEFLAGLFGGSEKGAVDVFQGDMLGTIEQESLRLYNELHQLEKDLKASDVSEKIQLAKTRAQLLDRITNIRQKAQGIKQMTEFQNTIIGILDEVVTPEQRTEVIDRIGAVVDMEVEVDI